MQIGPVRSLSQLAMALPQFPRVRGEVRRMTRSLLRLAYLEVSNVFTTFDC